MTAVTVPNETATEIVTPAELRRARIIGILYFVLAAFVILVFALDAEGDTTFRLTRATDRFSDFPDLTVPASGVSYVIAVVLAFLGGLQLSRGFGKRANLVLGIGLALFVFAFLAWAAAGRSFSLVGMLQESVFRAVPIAFGALSGVLCERVAVINIGIEGMLLGGAFTGAIVGSAVGGTAGTIVGILSATLVGALLAAVLAVLAIRYRVDQIIAGVVINIFALGMTSFLTSQILVENQDLNDTEILRAVSIPLLSDIPLIGPVLFDQNIYVYAMFLLVVSTTYGLFRTRWGLRSRAVGEHPKAADTLGINVFRLRYLNVILGGAVAGFGGAFFTIGSVGRFDENMTAGRGFIGLAAMIFGRWHPVGALSAALVFGFADALQIKLGVLDTGIPSEFLLMAPYIVTIVVVAGLVGKARPPAADGQPYVKE
jgi:simple sugar transport system permease protein